MTETVEEIRDEALRILRAKIDAGELEQVSVGKKREGVVTLKGGSEVPSILFEVIDRGMRSESLEEVLKEHVLRELQQRMDGAGIRLSVITKGEEGNRTHELHFH